MRHFCLFFSSLQNWERFKFINSIILTLLSADSNRSFSSNLCSVAVAWAVASGSAPCTFPFAPLNLLFVSLFVRFELLRECWTDSQPEILLFLSHQFWLAFLSFSSLKTGTLVALFTPAICFCWFFIFVLNGKSFFSSFGTVNLWNIRFFRWTGL